MHVHAHTRINRSMAVEIRRGNRKAQAGQHELLRWRGETSDLQRCTDVSAGALPLAPWFSATSFHTQTRIHPCTEANTHRFEHAHMHARARAHTHTRTRTHAHAHARKHGSLLRDSGFLLLICFLFLLLICFLFLL